MVSQGIPSLTHGPRGWGRTCDSSLQRVKADTDHSTITMILNFPQVHRQTARWCQAEEPMEGTGFLGTWPDHAGQGHVPHSQPAEKSSLSLWDTPWPCVRPEGHG